MPPRKGFLEMKVEEREKFFDGIKKKKNFFSPPHSLDRRPKKTERGANSSLFVLVLLSSFSLFRITMAAAAWRGALSRNLQELR